MREEGGPGTIALLYLDPAWSLLKPPGDVLDPIVWIYKQFARDWCGGPGIGTVTLLRHAPQLSKSALVNDSVEYDSRIRKEHQIIYLLFHSSPLVLRLLNCILCFKIVDNFSNCSASAEFRNVK